MENVVVLGDSHTKVFRKKMKTFVFTAASIRGLSNKNSESKTNVEIERVLNSLAPAFIRTTNKALERERKKDLSLASNEVKEKLTQSLAQVSEKYKIPEAEILRNVISMLS